MRVIVETRVRRITVRIMWRAVFVCAAISIFAGAAFGAGEYQRSKDGKTLIWNADPKSEDSASWWGERDNHGYAKGVGELTWYKGQGTVYARYYGNMVHGKLDGPVNVHVNGRTAHAFFSAGKRMTGWARGPASSRFATDWRSALARENAGSAPATSPPPISTEPVSASEELRSSAQQTQESPAEGPAAEAARPPRGEESPTKPEENVQRPTPGPSPQSSGAAGPPPESYSAAGVEQSKTKTAKTESRRPEKSEQRPVDAARERSESHPSSSIPYPSANTSQSAPRPTQDHGSLAELAVPPSALRNEPTVETPSTAPEADLASSPSATAHLTTDEAVEIADTEARARGYDLSEYQRPTADYSKVKGKWSLVYDLKKPDVVQDKPHRLRVTIDDASRKADVSP
jgi:hypothetical protein